MIHRMAVFCWAVWSFAPFSNAGLPFLSHLAGDHELPLPWGVAIDAFNMEQPYEIQDLSFRARNGLELPLVDGIEVQNEVTHFDFKVDAWLLPFLNLFAIVGDLDGTTDVRIPPLPLPVPLERVTVQYDGLVYGGGAVLVVGGNHWFATVTTTFSKTDLSGDFESTVKALTLQPRVGYPFKHVQVWVGGMFLDAQEKHKGALELPGIGLVDFEVALSEKEAWNSTVGGNIVFSKHWQLTLDAGFGDRDTLLGTLNFRF